MNVPVKDLPKQILTHYKGGKKIKRVTTYASSKREAGEKFLITLQNGQVDEWVYVTGFYPHWHLL